MKTNEQKLNELTGLHNQLDTLRKRMTPEQLRSFQKQTNNQKDIIGSWRAGHIGDQQYQHALEYSIDIATKVLAPEAAQ